MQLRYLNVLFMKAIFINHKRSACLVLFLDVCISAKASTTKDYYFIFSLFLKRSAYGLLLVCFLPLLNSTAFYLITRLFIFFTGYFVKKRILKFQDFFNNLNTFFVKNSLLSANFT